MSATSSTAVGAVELREVATRLGSKNGRKGKMAKLTVSATKPLVWPEMDRSDDDVEGDLRRRRFGRGHCGGLGRCEHSGLGCSMKWTAATCSRSPSGHKLVSIILPVSLST